MGEQHGTGELLKGHARHGLNLGREGLHFVRNREPRRGFDLKLKKRDLCGLQLSVGLHACTTLLPLCTVAVPVRLKRYFGCSISRAARHDFVFRFGQRRKTRRAAVKRERHRVKNRGFPRARGARDGKNAGCCVGRVVQRHGPAAFEGI